MTHIPGRAQLRTLWDYLRTSLWFIPILMMIAAVALAAVTLALDTNLSVSGVSEAPWFVYISAPAEARELVSTLLSSMIAMVALVFSITMVVLTLAANQFGPRLVRNFMASPHTQLILGAFVMTIAYCLLVLGAMGSRDVPGHHPFATVTVAIALGVLSVALLVLHLHILARSIMSETVIERVSEELDQLMNEYPPLASAQRGTEVSLPQDFETRTHLFGPNRAGYVQAIDFDSVVAAAAASSVVVRLAFRPGDFVVEGGSGIAIYPRERFTNELAHAIDKAILIGTHRTPVQDPTFAVRHLVEIAVRALSPGVNDPYTAAAAVDQLSVSLCRFMRLALPTGLECDANGVLRVAYSSPTHGSLIAAAFDQIRQNGADKPIVLIHLIEAIGRVSDHAQEEAQQQSLRKQLQIIEEAAKRSVVDPSDLEDVLSRAMVARSSLERSVSSGRIVGHSGPH